MLEKGIEFKTRLQLACDIIDEHTPLAKKTIWLLDSLFTCQEMASKCKLSRLQLGRRD